MLQLSLMIPFLLRNIFDTFSTKYWILTSDFILPSPPTSPPSIFLVWITSGGAADYLIQIQIFRSIRHPKPPAGGGGAPD